MEKTYYQAGAARLTVVIDDEAGTATVTGHCVVTGKQHSVTVPANEMRRFLDKNRPLVQACFPTTDPDDREFLISGISPEGWKDTVGQNGSAFIDRENHGDDYESQAGEPKPDEEGWPL